MERLRKDSLDTANSGALNMAVEVYVTRVFSSPTQVNAEAWQALLAQEPDASPFVQHAYLSALHETGCARPPAGWQPQFLTLWRGDVLHAACPLYLKNHSYGEYVFDWAWANAYAQHGLDYYPKALVAVPFTPVPGARLLAVDEPARAALAQALIEHTRAENLSSLHILFVQPQDIAACEQAGMMLRHTVQFHWTNVAPTLPAARGALPPEGAVSPWGGPAAKPGGVIRRKSAPSSTVAPSLVNSVAIAASRSVSLTRQLAMLRKVVVPWAYNAMTASVIAASGMWLQSRSIDFSGQAPREIEIPFGSPTMWAPICRAASTKRMSPWIESSPTPCSHNGASAAPASAPSAIK